jgi:acyl-coenzyme A synthetase/AMP-(fatty) acid ligase
MLRNHELCSRYNLSSIATIFTGAAPLGLETATDLQKAYPNVIIRQGYGETFQVSVHCIDTNVTVKVSLRQAHLFARHM